MIDFEDIRQKVVAQHNVLLGRDDAILVTVTLNEMVLSRYFEMAARHAETTSRELSVAIQRQTEQSKEVAGKIITAAADYVRKEVHEAVKSAAAEAASEFSIEITGKIGDATAASRAAELRSRESERARAVAVAAAIVACVTAASAFGAVVAVLALRG